MCRIRDKPVYRRDAFIQGLQKAGFGIKQQGSPKSRHDWLVLWNRYGPGEVEADAWEKDGGTVLITENGYIGKDSENRPLYAISAGQHNGAGVFPVGNESRSRVTLKPWRTEGEHILICGQRGIGSKLMASPSNWHIDAARRLSKMTDRKIRLRAHPGSQPPKVPLEEDLSNAWAVCIWSSGSGVKALAEGIPVFYAAPYWIAGEAATRLNGVFGIETPLCDDECRRNAFHKLSYGQWTVGEIGSGEPFIRIRDSIA